MLGLILSVVITGGFLQDAQAQPPVFRAEVHAVPIQFSVFRKLPFGIRRPYKGLTVADVSIVLENKTYVPVDMKENTRGHYLANFTPPDEYRDGKTHAIEVRIKKFPMFALTVTIPKPGPPHD